MSEVMISNLLLVLIAYLLYRVGNKIEEGVGRLNLSIKQVWDILPKTISDKWRY